jgi:hypothetical protein
MFCLEVEVLVRPLRLLDPLIKKPPLSVSHPKYQFWSHNVLIYKAI